MAPSVKLLFGSPACVTCQSKSCGVVLVLRRHSGAGWLADANGDLPPRFCEILHLKNKVTPGVTEDLSVYTHMYPFMYTHAFIRTELLNQALENEYPHYG